MLFSTYQWLASRAGLSFETDLTKQPHVDQNQHFCELAIFAQNGHICCTPSICSVLQSASAACGIKVRSGEVLEVQQLAVCKCCTPTAGMAISSGENGAPMASYSTTAGLCMFVLSMLLKQLPNDIVVVTHVTSTLSRILDV
jgi:hypothetical protein